MRIAICDDDDYYREKIATLANAYAIENKEKSLSIYSFTNGEDVIDNIKKHGEFDIYILDIVMPGMNGIELGKALRENGYDGKVIYLTTSEEFAVDSYKVGAFNYCLKPVDDAEFTACLEKAVLSIHRRTGGFIVVKTKESSIKLSFDNILYAHLTGRNILYHTKDGRNIESLSVRTSFGDTVKPLLADKAFYQCGASLLCNMHYITEVGNEHVSFGDKATICLTRKMCREIRSAWIDFCIEEAKRQ